MSILVLFLLLAAEEPVLRGRLCIEKQCTDTTGRVFAVAPDERAQRFVWTSADASTVQLGVVPPKAEQVALDAGERSELTLTIAGDATRGWPYDVQADVRGRAQWQWTLDAPQKLRRLIVPRGSRYNVTLEAEHHRRFLRMVEARDEKAALGELALLPLPLVRGLVVDAEGKAIAGALVSDPDGELCTLADPLGAFACELEESFRHQALVVSAAGHGERDVPLPRRIEKDVDAGRIELAAGYTVAVKIVRPAASSPATVSLMRRDRQTGESRKLKSHELKAAEESVRFDAGTGEYALLVSGNGALEKLELPVAVRDADVSETITLAPYRVDGTVRIGDEPLAAGAVQLRSREGSWHGALDVRDGVFVGTLWQNDGLTAHVVNREMGMVEWVETPRLGGDPSHWDIRIASRFLTGRVFDASTKAAVAGATLALHLRMRNGGSLSSAAVKTAEDGTYRVLATRAGTYTLRASAPDYVPAEVEAVVADGDPGRRIDLPLERGSALTLEIVSQSGQPLPSARVVELVERNRTKSQDISSADGAGRVVLRGRPGERRVLYVMSHQASFAVLRVSVPAGASPPLRVVLPDATGALRVQVTGGEFFLVRYNGEFLPGWILGYLAGGYEAGPDGIVLPRLPAGTYEVWGLADPFEEATLIASNGTLRPPVRVGVSGGEAGVQVVAPPRPGRE